MVEGIEVCWSANNLRETYEFLARTRELTVIPENLKSTSRKQAMSISLKSRGSSRS